MYKTIIRGTGSYVPEQVKSNKDFLNASFYDENRGALNKSNEYIVEKFKAITGIENRRYAGKEENASDLAVHAAKRAIESAGTDAETIDMIIVAHNFGDVVSSSVQSDMVPSLANRVKAKLGIQNPDCVAYDILFGCPGWVQALILAEAYGRAGMANRCLLIGAETLSRVVDVHDRDAMIFADGAGAVVTEYLDSESAGIMAVASRSFSLQESNYINMGETYAAGSDSNVKYIKMKGRKVYEFSLIQVPLAMKACMDKAGVDIGELKKIFIHQANEKMDEAIINRFYGLYDMVPPKGVMPMCIQELGNSSVATVPTLFDMVVKGEMPDHELKKGDIVLFASVGAGMNINAVCYRY